MDKNKLDEDKVYEFFDKIKKVKKQEYLTYATQFLEYTKKHKEIETVISNFNKLDIDIKGPPTNKREKKILYKELKDLDINDMLAKL